MDFNFFSMQVPTGSTKYEKNRNRCCKNLSLKFCTQRKLILVLILRKIIFFIDSFFIHQQFNLNKQKQTVNFQSLYLKNTCFFLFFLRNVTLFLNQSIYNPLLFPYQLNVVEGIPRIPKITVLCHQFSRISFLISSARQPFISIKRYFKVLHNVLCTLC